MLVVSGDQPDKGRNGAKRTSHVGKGRRKRGTGSVGPSVTEGKGVGTQGGRYARLFMRESEEEEVVHGYNVTADDLYKGMENM